jgi:ABC-2 type transport system ATP-binding protein
MTYVQLYQTMAYNEPMSMIDVRELGKRFGELEAVAGISFSVEIGEIFGFLGPNGAGKTTTMKMLCTLLEPSSGRASVNGCDVVRQRDEVRRSLGITFQDPSLDEQLTARENLIFHAMIYKIPRAEQDARVEQALELVDLTDKSGVIVKTFSGGMKRRLELARSLLHRPAVLFLDEPTLGLDPQTRRKIWDYLKDLREKRKLTLFLTTHYMEEAESCDRIAIIDNGKIVALDTPAALKSRIGKDVIELVSHHPEALAEELKTSFAAQPTVAQGKVSIAVERGDEFIVTMIPRLHTPLLSLNVRKPTLEDVFVGMTGHAIRDDENDKLDLLRTVYRKRSRR